MKQSEVNKIKEFYLTGGTKSAWAKLYATTNDATVLKIAQIGSELYAHSYKPHYSGPKIIIEDLPEFWNNASLTTAKIQFAQQYLKPIVDGEVERIERKTLAELIDKGLSIDKN